MILEHHVHAAESGLQRMPSMPPSAGMRRNLRILPWWWVLRWMWLGEGIWVLYLTEERGLTLGQALLFEALYAAVVVVTELPTGMVADRFGRRVSVIAGTAFVSIGFIAFGGFSEFGWLLGGYVLLAIAETSFSGADTVLLYDSLKANGRGEDFTRWHGRLNAVAMGVIAIFTIAGSVMVLWWPMWTPIVLSGALTIPVVVLAFFLKEPPRTDKRHTYMGTGRAAVALVAREPAFIAAMVLMMVTTQTIVFVSVVQQQFLLDAGVPLWAIGPAVAAQVGAAAVGSWLSESVGRWLKLRRTFLWMPLLCSLALLAAMPGSVWLYPLFILPAVGWNVLFPQFTDYLARRVTDSLRATTMSIANLIAGASAIVGMPLVGLSMDRLGFQVTLALTTAALTTVALVASFVWIRSGGETVPVVVDPDRIDGEEASAVPSTEVTG